MFATLIRSATVSLRIMAITAILMSPVAALAYSKASDLGISKQGAGLVLFVTLQRQSMI